MKTVFSTLQYPAPYYPPQTFKNTSKELKSRLFSAVIRKRKQVQSIFSMVHIIEVIDFSLKKSGGAIFSEKKKLFKMKYKDKQFK